MLVCTAIELIYTSIIKYKCTLRTVEPYLSHSEYTLPLTRDLPGAPQMQVAGRKKNVDKIPNQIVLPEYFKHVWLQKVL